MKPATLEYVKKRFSSYYNGEISGAGAFFPPTSLIQREWGFLFFSADQKTGMRRHIDFSTEDNLREYLKAMTPAHVYYSSAYYEHPSAGTMDEKSWIGADLIFDLDADHILHAPYEVMLSRVKEELFKLIDMLTEELGFNKKDLKINFSGGRGYHIHIPLIAVRNMDSNSRRQLADYVSGVGLSSETMLTTSAAQGWPVRWKAALTEELRSIEAMSPLDAKAYLTGIQGINERQASLLIKNIAEIKEKVKINPSSLKDNKTIAALTSHENPVFLEKIHAYAAQVDEPVTADIKRLIRFPGSLHGGSGMQALNLELSELERFDPLIDPVIFSEEKTKISCKFPLKMPILGNNYELTAGENTVPEALAIFLCCRGIAEIGGES